MKIKVSLTLFILGIFISGILAGLFIVGAIIGNDIFRVIGTFSVLGLLVTRWTVGKKVYKEVAQITE